MVADLRHSEKRFRTLFKNIPDAVFLIDGNGVFVDGNPQAERLSGYACS
jgi:PAS domain S-box-containing protein